MNKIEVIPAIIPESLGYIHDRAGRVADFVHRIQIDVMDGDFASSTSWPFLNQETREELSKMAEDGKRLVEGVEFEIDMMIHDPQYFIDEWMNVGASAIIVHVDSTKSLSEIIERARARGVSVGVAFKPSYGLGSIEEFMSGISFVQIMGNDRIGYHGVDLDDRVYTLLKELKTKYPHVTIGVDIGVNKKTAPKLVEAGATRLVSGTAIFGKENNSKNIEEAINFFKNL